MAVTPTGLVIAAGLGAAVGQLARVAGRVLRSDGDLAGALTAEVQRLVRDGLRLAGIVAAVLVGYWLLGLAAILVLLLLVAGLFAGASLDSGAAPVLIGGAAVAGVAFFGLALLLVERVLRRVRDTVQADLDLGVPLLGPGRLLVWISSVMLTAAYAAAAGGSGGAFA